jgi:hypothetical protein
MIFSVINTTRAKIYLFTTGTLYKIDSRTLVFAPSGQGFFYLNLPARSHSGDMRILHDIFPFLDEAAAMHTFIAPSLAWEAFTGPCEQPHFISHWPGKLLYKH